MNKQIADMSMSSTASKGARNKSKTAAKPYNPHNNLSINSKNQ